MTYPRLATALLACFCTLGACAQQSAAPAPGPATNAPDFASFDADGDGSISAQEFHSLRAQRRAAAAQAGRPMRGAAYAPSFEQIDANADGAISRDEFNAVHAGRGACQQRANAPCAMGAGAAAMAAQRPVFADFDRDGNGAISQAEWLQMRSQRMQQRAAQGRMMRGAGSAPAFAQIDANADGAIDPAEFAQHQKDAASSMGGQR